MQVLGSLDLPVYDFREAQNLQSQLRQEFVVFILVGVDAESDYACLEVAVSKSFIFGEIKCPLFFKLLGGEISITRDLSRKG